MTTATAITKVGRAPKGGAVSRVNGRHYKGGWFMPLEKDTLEGIDELRASIAEHDRYMDAMEAMWDSGSSRGPARPVSDLEGLKSRYVGAALYLKAEAYSDASNFMKSAAGTRAMEALKAGGTIDEAAAILDGWLAGHYVD